MVKRWMLLLPMKYFQSLFSSNERKIASKIKSKSSRRDSENKASPPFLETMREWLPSLTPKKLQEFELEDAGKHGSGISSETTLVKKQKILTVHAEDNPSHGRTLNLYEAFGTTAKKTAPGSGFQPLLVVEMNENGMLKRHLVPYRHSMEGKWVLYGRHVYVLRGHSFVEHRSTPSFVSCLITGFRMAQSFFQCKDCEYVCHYLQEATVALDCPVAKILSQEMNFPYDVTETKPEKVHHLRMSQNRVPSTK